MKSLLLCLLSELKKRKVEGTTQKSRLNCTACVFLQNPRNGGTEQILRFFIRPDQQYLAAF